MYQASLSIQSQISMNSGLEVPLYPSSWMTVTFEELAAHAFRDLLWENYDQAETKCQYLQAEYGENAFLFFLLGLINLKKRKFDLANNFAEKAITLNEWFAEPKIIKAIVFKETGNLYNAINYFNIAAGLLPDSPTPLFGLAYCYLDFNEIDVAIQFFHLAHTKRPESSIYLKELCKQIQISGNIDKEKICFEKLIQYKPNIGAVWLQLGHFQMNSGFTWKALDNFERAISFDPSNIDAYIAYGNSLKSIKLYERACLIFLRGMTLFPSKVDLQLCLARTLYNLGFLDLSIDIFMQVLQLTPNDPDAHCYLAKTLKFQGNIKEAEKHYKIAIHICPSHALSINNLATIRKEQGRITESIKLYQMAISASPNFFFAHLNLAKIFMKCRRLDAANLYINKAVELNPASLDTHLSLGKALRKFNNLKGAVDSCIKAIKINPLSYIAHTYLGSNYFDLGHITEAIIEFRLALKLKSNYFSAFFNLVFAQQKICDWIDYESLINRLISIVDEELKKQCPLAIEAHHTMLYPLSPSQRLSIAYQKASFCVDKSKYHGYTPFCHEIPYNITLRYRLRIGYVSSDFCHHPTSHLIQSIPGLHDRTQIEVFCYALSASDGSSYRRKLESEVEHFMDVSGILCVKDIADLIYKHGVHILLNLNGYTYGARNEIFALRPSPIQAIYLGYPGTSGAEYIDYIITDSITSPPEHKGHYSEKFAYMPNSFFIGDHANMFPHVLFDLTHQQVIKPIIPQLDAVLPKNVLYASNDLRSIEDGKSLNSYVRFHIDKRAKECQGCIYFGEAIPDHKVWILDRSFYGLHENLFVFCNFNQFYKLNPETFSCWCRILARVPNSVIWLLRFNLAGEDNLRKEAQKHGIENQRLVFTDLARKEEHVRRGQLADICLDTPLCNGHTTGLDLLWAGCPIITLPLDTFASRVGSSILSAIGCPELITYSYDEYEELAVRLGTDRQYFKKIKKKIWLNRMTSSLFNVNQYAKDFDNLLLKIGSSFFQNKNPTHIE